MQNDEATDKTLVRKQQRWNVTIFCVFVELRRLKKKEMKH